MRLISIITICFFLVACNKPDPNPELKDPIYGDLTSSLASISQQLEAQKKTLEEHEQALKDVVPQTGQIKYAQKRVNETKALITRLDQEKQYLELKIEARKKQSKKSYLQAFKKNEPWPDPKEWDSYQVEKKLRAAKKDWSVQERMKELGFGNEKAPAPTAEGSSH
ncbi:hypothetical protein QJS83_03955 [Bdellovibrio sp. 22V]|uniref:hypothetical protein n=1 Tax=Bdellovibrio TaxID=958 RepID=UPI002543C4AE|nr:hypothetical protein [Bdellovibrio sp. 22V]WII73025.1 hypothetical protein QJS83_03955 [Bdellovibrio sp. 22V]